LTRDVTQPGPARPWPTRPWRPLSLPFSHLIFPRSNSLSSTSPSTLCPRCFGDGYRRIWIPEVSSPLPLSLSLSLSLSSSSSPSLPCVRPLLPPPPRALAARLALPGGAAPSPPRRGSPSPCMRSPRPLRVAPRPLTRGPCPRQRGPSVRPLRVARHGQHAPARVVVDFLF
jgi:hypothetical protein